MKTLTFYRLIILMLLKLKKNGKKCFKSAKSFIKDFELPWYVVFYLVTIYFSSVLNFQIIDNFYRILDDSKFATPLFCITPPLVLFALLSLVFVVFLFKYLFKPLFAFLILLASITSYFSYKYGIIYDEYVIREILDSNFEDVASVCTLSFVFNVLIYGVIPSLLLLKVKIKWADNLNNAILGRLLMVAISSLILFVIGGNYYQNYASIYRHNPILQKEISPFNFIYIASKTINETYFKDTTPFNVIGADASMKHQDVKPDIFVVVVGETARAQNFDFNGYSRNTTPFTKDLPNFVNYKNVSSCGTDASVSIPCMFSIMERSDYDENLAKNSTSLVDTLNYAGFDVMWFDNDKGCHGVCDRTPYEVMNVKDVTINDLCDKDGCYDEVLLRKLNPFINDAVKANKDTVIFLHLVGNREPYNKRVPENMKVFTPTCENSDQQKCSVEEIVNSYDNTIIYTDYIIKNIVDILDSYKDDVSTGLIYISDHGESLGEFGIFLHGSPFQIAPEYQKKVPMMTWFSDGFILDHRLDMNCIKKKAQTENFSHDNFYHSILGALEVESSLYDYSLDIFKKCQFLQKE